MNPDRRTLFQTAYYVSDIEAAAHKWNRLYGAGPFVMLPHHKFDSYRYRGTDLAPGTFPDFSYGMGYLGDLMIQFTHQHDDRPSVYRDMYKAGEEGLHHIAYLTGSFDEECERMDAKGHARGSQFTGDGVQGCYFDTRADTQCFTEVHSNEKHLMDAFADWRRAHELMKAGDSPIFGG